MRYVQTRRSLRRSSTHNSCRSSQCTWVKNSARKPPRTEAYIDSMQKQIEDFRNWYSEVWQYAKYLESQLDECHSNVDFRASRPPDHDALMSQEDESDIMMGGEDNDQSSDDGNESKVMAICIPPQSLQVCWGCFVIRQCLTVYILIKVEPFTQPSRFPAVAENPYETYVLMVDGAQQSHFNPSLDWSRHLPSSNVPLDRPTHDRFVLIFQLTSSIFITYCTGHSTFFLNFSLPGVFAAYLPFF